MMLQGKRTYLFLAGVAVSLATGFMSRKGIDLGLDANDVNDISNALALLMAGGAAWARSQAKLPVLDEQDVPKARPNSKKRKS